jgi:hypothetical protein
MVATSNFILSTNGLYRPCLLTVLLQKESASLAYHLCNNHAITNSSATQMFVMEGSNVINKQQTACPLKVASVDGHQVMLTCMCDIHIEGLPFVLTGHIIPTLSIALLFGIQALTEVECIISFDKHKCVVRHNGNIIFSGGKNPATDLWTLLLG